LKGELENKIDRKELTLPPGTSVASLSQEECGDIMAVLSRRGPRDILAGVPDDAMAIFDSFHSVSDPFEFLLMLSQELQGYSEMAIEYTSDTIDEWIEEHKEESPDEHSLYEGVCDSLPGFLIFEFKSLGYLTASIIKHRDMILPSPDAATWVTQALAMLQLVHDNFENALLEYYRELRCLI
jgi:hypothetical protein